MPKGIKKKKEVVTPIKAPKTVGATKEPKFGWEEELPRGQEA